MRNIKIELEYDGTEFAGWQRQPNGAGVQEAVEDAAAAVLGHAVSLVGAGRTDRGVHAVGQAANFRTERRIPVERIPYALNAHLPPAIRVRAAADMPPEFHALRNATGKHYRYTLFSGDIAPAIGRRYAAVVPPGLMLEPMVQAAAHMEGAYDVRAFRSFAKGQEGSNTLKTVWRVLVRSDGPYFFVDVLGSGFVYTQMRTMAGTLLLAGRGRLVPSDVAAIIASRDRRRAGPTLPPEGLCLIKVFYDPEPAAWYVPAAPRGWMA
ncbi:MAG TPA: tRNA pseudouridine(38-40) synthase TruA [Planctomycetota bacterium]|nr:tRNA pseudouridine(38-40) synthase TruA [Planctomycetota bacterium]OQC21842.1 MAG: tRNA pseudouridine synthase A [Planctomycetes bacterium ADurb.Bin069]HNR98207.1 tRNA pseudouridine(38-40) synthase TruA [Planctomycetota bacterium]HNU24924.1 tRNA pseudouridine(38-40) synthase TruA [Planctomycetota bacterium]HOE29526.1 tRNA pseudouridine(38-40) synthase TruA [Planctomycetota bacterium]